MQTERALVLIVQCYCRRKKPHTKKRQYLRLLLFLLMRLLIKKTDMKLLERNPITNLEKWIYRFTVIAAVVIEAIKKIVELFS